MSDTCSCGRPLETVIVCGGCGSDQSDCDEKCLTCGLRASSNAHAEIYGTDKHRPTPASPEEHRT